MSKQILIDYSEYLELEKARQQVEIIRNECQNGALVQQESINIVQGTKKIETKIILTANMENTIIEIGGSKNG